ncbi:endonuclease [Gordonia sp. zg691]|uniref:Endonuclease n=1 Tax=Gordonia jinghuaiqii TaxID=2758710 RepID=A0A7D7LYU1_9ACTN|nr:endonuclease [Gordonia jinghuaiqii]MBD0863727.1 endonuclease [Gordonia jinghuaiqii]MCR5980053.1 endonuclease [Gordonia jinghuaiqii]QMT03239.1 endonuclease [Gordonia jinghuaiqii]
MTRDHDATQIVSTLLDRAGRTYADEAGIALKDTPAPLFELLVLALLLSTRISAGIAVAAARELFAAGFRTPEKMAHAHRQSLVAALGRGRYVRYDESTATRLVQAGRKVLDDYHGDLRELARAADSDATRAAKSLQEFTGIGPVGADIFLREVQSVWNWVAPHFDKRALSAARDLGLPDDPDELAGLAGGRPEVLAAALVRASLDDELRAGLG